MMGIHRFERLERRECLAAVTYVPNRVVDLTRIDDSSEVLIAADVDGDGDNDLVTRLGNQLIWLQNNRDSGNFQFAPDQVIETSGGESVSLVASDFDQNGLIDLVMMMDNSEIRVYRNRGNGTFAEPVVVQNRSNARGFSLNVADIDGDGDEDLVSAHGAPSARVTWFENLGGYDQMQDGVPLYEGPFSPHSNLVVSDLDGDLRMDLLLSLRAGNGEYQLAVFRGRDEFLPELEIVASGSGLIEHIEVVDIDTDSDGDIFAVTDDGRLIWFRNEGMSFSSEIGVAASNSQFSFEVSSGDIDLDGDVDLVVNGDSGVIWIERESNNSFGLGGTLVGDSFSITSFILSDTDSDGDLDAFLATVGDDELYWFRAHLAGDANDDGVFDSGDLVQAFQSGKYETDEEAVFSEGDWNGDGVFNSSDLVFVFQNGSFME